MSKVAKSYQGYSYDETKAYEKNGKKYVLAECKCDRCVKGVYVTRVENGQPVPHPAFGGVCLKCGGSGVIRKEVRLYTDAEFDAMERSKARQAVQKAEKQEKKMQAEYTGNRADWLQRNGFTADGITYVYYPDNSFSVKDTLKEDGFIFNPNLFWHIAIIPEGYEDKVVTIQIADVVEFSAWGKGNFKAEAKGFVNAQMKAARPVEENNSEWIGEEGKRLRDIPVILKSIRELETAYGWTQLVKFEDKSGNEINWWTSCMIDAEVGQEILLTGTVKKHDEYQDRKITVLTRCKIKAE